MSGAISPIPLYTFVVWTGILLDFHFINFARSNSRSITEDVSRKDWNGRVSGFVRVISTEFILEDWVKS